MVTCLPFFGDSVNHCKLLPECSELSHLVLPYFCLMASLWWCILWVLICSYHFVLPFVFLTYQYICCYADGINVELHTFHFFVLFFHGSVLRASQLYIGQDPVCIVCRLCAGRFWEVHAGVTVKMLLHIS